MENPSLPPPLPPAGKKGGSRILIAVIATVAALVVIGLLAGIPTGVSAFRQVQEKRAAMRTAVDELQSAAAEERSKMADSLEAGEITGGGEALGRMKEQLEKSASQFGGNDAAAARAGAAYLGTVQARVREYEASIARLTELEIFSFNPRDKATLEAHRQIVKDFVAINAQLTDTVQRGEELMGAELDAAKVSARTRKSALDGFTKSQLPGRALQLQIRSSDQSLGEAALAMFDLLEQNWGKWRLDDASGAKVFDDSAILKAHDVLIEKVQAAAADQAKAQEELANRLRSGRSP